MMLTILLLGMLAVPAIASAEPPGYGPYLTVFIGATMPEDADVTGFDLNDEVEFDPGVYVGGAYGFDYGYLRLEGEIAYKQGEISRVHDRVARDTFTDIDGWIGATSFMGNVYFDMHNAGPITPYIGGGLGFAVLHQSDTTGTSSFDGRRIDLYESDDDAVFAYQIGAGLEIALSRVLSLDLSYRYFGTSLAEFEEGTSFGDSEMKFRSHNAAAGLRVKF